MIEGKEKGVKLFRVVAHLVLLCLFLISGFRASYDLVVLIIGKFWFSLGERWLCAEKLAVSLNTSSVEYSVSFSWWTYWIIISSTCRSNIKKTSKFSANVRLWEYLKHLPHIQHSSDQVFGLIITATLASICVQMTNTDKYVGSYS